MKPFLWRSGSTSPVMSVSGEAERPSRSREGNFPIQLYTVSVEGTRRRRGQSGRCAVFQVCGRPGSSENVKSLHLMPCGGDRHQQEWIRAARGSTRTQFESALCVEIGGGPDLDEAARSLKIAAGQGTCAGPIPLREVPCDRSRDDVAAVRYYKLAADQADAEFHFGQCLARSGH
jgi:hypothetical protein